MLQLLFKTFQNFKTISKSFYKPECLKLKNEGFLEILLMKMKLSHKASEQQLRWKTGGGRSVSAKIKVIAA